MSTEVAGHAANSVEKAIYQMLLGNMWGFPFIHVGNVFFVHGFTGLNTNDGRSPASPFLTIAFALTQCVADNDDVIIVMEHWQEAMPIAINITRVHILGVSRSENHPFPLLNATDNTAIFTVTALSNNCEIAGLGFGGGATNPGILNAAGTPMGLYIHDCTFGHTFAGNTPQDGIRIEVNATNIRIERCTFFGTSTKGTITRDGIRFQGGGDPLGGVISKNTFHFLPGVAIDMVAAAAGTGGFLIEKNLLSPPADAQGTGITLGATVAGCFVVGNRAQFGSNAMATNPYLDLSAVDWNHWTDNMSGNALIWPA